VIWRNWAGDQSCEPGAIAYPRGVEEVVAVVEEAARRNQKVRAVGAGHSFTPAVLTDGLLLSLDRLDRVLDVDRDRGLVHVEAGIRLHALNESLASHGLAMENLGDVDVQSIAGATSTGTHGTGSRLPNISAAVHALEIVTAGGSVLEVSEATDPDAWRAARIAIGSLGVITTMTLKVVPAFTLRGIDGPEPLGEVLSSLDERIDTNEHFEFYTFPHSPLAHVRSNNRVEEVPRPWSKRKEWFENVFLRNYVLGSILRLERRFPATIPALNRLVPKVGRRTERVDASYRIFASPRLFRFTEMEYAIPRSGAAEAVRAVRGIADRKELKVSMPIEVRFVAPDDAFLSPSAGRETCYVAVHAFERTPWEAYFRAVEEVMDSFQGRPHWGKRHFQTAATLAPRYPDWERFQAVRNRLDPGRLFTNSYVRAVLGP
jgi:L-gulono-1,4-lactone dehydrogenase